MARTLQSLAVVIAAVLVGCTSPAERAARAQDEYQVAMNAGDFTTAKSAMMRAVQAKEDDAVSWLGLGQAQIGLGDLAGAYDSYSRANELDRGNVEALQILADLSLLAGRVRDAERFAEQLQLLQPATAGPITTQGYIALKRKNAVLAVEKADAALALRPFDAGATILKARALSTQLQHAKGAELLEAHIAARGPDASVLSTLLKLYERDGAPQSALRTLARLAALEPANDERAFAYASALYRSGKPDEARAITLRLAAGDVTPERLTEILDLWSAHEKAARARLNIAGLVEQAAPPSRVRYANFLLRAGWPQNAEALMRPQAGVPVTAENADATAVFAHARGIGGDLTMAMPMLEAVLRFDPGNDLALRARVDLGLSAGHCQRTFADARRLTVENPQSPEDRIRLAKCYALRGNTSLAETTYWTAFRELPGNALLYESFKRFLSGHGRSASVELLTQRYEEQNRNLAAAAFAKG